MRVMVHPADEGGCGMYRLAWPARALAAEGMDVTVKFDFSYTCEWLDTIQGPTVRKVLGDVRHDVVVLQRPLHRNRYELIAALQARGVAVVVEVDDDFHAIHPRNPAWKGTNPLDDRDVHRDWLMRSCQIADLVTVSTPALAQRYGVHGRCIVLDNYVPERYCTIDRPEHDRVRVGWSGAVQTHPGDLEETGGGVAAAVRAHGAALHAVGTGEGVGAAFGYVGKVHAAGWVPIDEYPIELARLDVGVVPLKPSPFNEAKSHLKGLELAACGVPFVASPTGPYRRLADLGIGWLAKSPADWRYFVGEMIQDHDHRQAMSEQWRAEVAANWTVEANAWRWAEAWDRALRFSRERVAA